MESDNFKRSVAITFLLLVASVLIFGGCENKHMKATEACAGPASECTQACVKKFQDVERQKCTAACTDAQRKCEEEAVK